ncbi:hypothetical protein BD410DRAFT_844198 [Rickenella mellea]|uniref:PH domain-containing protein n=1 Tax=Rickenella mellea TaxID=50990 RepID=A0A4Y7PMP3_9AGAM|nr:hypothetical protein BD410DRAFT_844198 [Rickenella mellea]
MRNRSAGEESIYDDDGEATERGSVTDMEDYYNTRTRLASSGSGAKAVEGGVVGAAIGVGVGVGAAVAARIVGKVSYESLAVSTDAREQPPVELQPEREMKEMAMQTDEWVSLAPAPAVPTPPSPTPHSSPCLPPHPLRRLIPPYQEEDVGSRRSSTSSDHFHPPSLSLTQNGTASAIANPVTPSRNNTIMEFLYKYTRKAIGKGHGERRHKRFFWVHPYAKTLYWSSADPGSSNVSESSAKSAYIDSVRSVLDPNPMPPGLYQYSVVIATPQREMKTTAPTKERHDIWLDALQYLLARPTPVPVMSPGPETPPPGRLRENGKGKETFASPQSQRSAMTTDSWNITPPEYLRWADGPGSPTILGGQGFEHVPGAGADGDDDDLAFEIHDSIAHDPGFDGLENVRACCDGMGSTASVALDIPTITTTIITNTTLSSSRNMVVRVSVSHQTVFTPRDQFLRVGLSVHVRAAQNQVMAGLELVASSDALVPADRARPLEYHRVSKSG